MSSGTSTGSAAAKKILIAEDDAGILELLEVALAAQGYEVLTCADGREVEALAKQFSPSLIFLDLWMPGMDGRQITRKLKTDKQTKHIPVIIVSAQTGLAKIISKIGADGFLEKPFELQELLALAQKFTGN